MNLFELFVKIGVDDQASNKLEGLSSKLGNGLKTAAKIGTAAVGVAATGITALTTAAVKNYAEYEQLVGGVETLFKDSADVVQQYAANAYKTAGLSANEYMSTVTSFSASLLQSLGGDTEAAAKYADMAVSDMSDNANKMGTDMELIQNAYQGFAKQNYTMLDNLKLGYGGTKTEMERLVADAAKVDKSIDANSLSFGNIVAAINVVQKEMGIYGTTALEAEKTISGSLNAMKGAWSNLITGIADDNADFDALINNMVESAGAFAGNILPRIEVALGGIANLIEKLAPVIVEKIPSLVNTILPSLISGATGMVNSVIEVLPSLLETLVTALVENAPLLVEAAIGLVNSLIQGIMDNADLLVNGAVDIVVTLVDGILNMLPDIIKLGLDLIVSLALGIAEALPELVPALVETIGMIVDTLTSPDMLSQILGAALELIIQLAYGLMDAIPELVDACLDIIDNLVVFLLDPENLAKLINAALHIVIALGTGLIDAIPRLLGAQATLIKKVVENFMSTDWGQVGKDIVDGLLEGLKKAWESIKNWFGNAWDNLFGGRKVEIDAEVNERDSDGSHRNGLRYVPYDGYIAELHKGERVLTAEESRAYNEGRNISVVQNIYSSAKTAADLMREAKWEQDRAVFGLV